jgi:hypothetical protein
LGVSEWQDHTKEFLLENSRASRIEMSQANL